MSKTITLLFVPLLVLAGCTLQYDFTECTTDAECSRIEDPSDGAFFICNTDENTCESADIDCRDDAHCGEGQVCEQNTCRMVEDMDADSGTDTGDVGEEDATDTYDPFSDFPDVAAEQDHSGCAYPPTDDGCATGPFGPGSFVNEIKIVKDSSCCRDFDGDGNEDNGLALIVSTAESTLNQDINPNIAQSISSGESVTLLDYRYWTQRANDPSIIISAYSGVDADDDYSDNLAGLGEFLVSPEFLDENQDPIYQFEQAMVVDETIYAVGDRYPFKFLLSPALLDLDVRDVQFSAVVSNTPPSFSLKAGGAVEFEDGLITGIVRIENFYNEANDYTKNGCECIGEEIFARQSEGEWTCTVGDIEPAPECTAEEDGSFCQVIADGGQCSLLVNFIGNNLDHDFDGNGTPESLTLALEVEAVGANLSGVDDTGSSN